MRRVVPLPLEGTLPSAGAVLEGQGVPSGRSPDPRTARLAKEAIAVYAERARPVGLLLEIARDAFRIVYEGQGRNDPQSPVEPIYRASDSLALFAVTVGEEVCAEISRLFGNNDFALGSMLDAAASEATEMAARLLEDSYRRRLEAGRRLDGRHGLLRFSPGYCGWHVSAQRALFESLRPGEIGITLNDSFLMQPLKSISGVMISGEKEIFEFDDTFSFCAECATHECRDRIRGLRQS
jgi:hypothetical protein